MGAGRERGPVDFFGSETSSSTDGLRAFNSSAQKRPNLFLSEPDHSSSTLPFEIRVKTRWDGDDASVGLVLCVCALRKSKRFIIERMLVGVVSIVLAGWWTCNGLDL